MMKTLILFATLSVLISCRSEQKPATETASTPKLNFKEIKAPIPFTGSYISETYLTSIREQKSPRKAQENNDEECFIHIPDNTLVPTSMVVNFHEALTDLIPLNNNGTYELWEKQNDTLSKARYTIAIVAEDKIKIGDKTFVKTNPDFSGGQPLILEEILFKGTYQTKKGESVEFKKNGEVSGLGKYKYYTPMLDYFDAGRQIDQVGLGETRDKLDYFGFKFRKNGLDLYELKCKTFDANEKRCVDVDFGKKAFDLSKIEVKAK